MYHKVTVKFDTKDREGNNVKSSETYLVDAVSFTEAETLMFKMLEQDQEFNERVRGEFKVTNVAPLNVSEVIPKDHSADTYFKVRASYLSGKRTVNLIYILEAYDLIQAHQRISEHLGKIKDESGFQIKEISLVKIAGILDSEWVAAANGGTLAEYLGYADGEEENDDEDEERDPLEDKPLFITATPKKTLGEDLDKLAKNMEAEEEPRSLSLEEFKDRKFGKVGTKTRAAAEEDLAVMREEDLPSKKSAKKPKVWEAPDEEEAELDVPPADISMI